MDCHMDVTKQTLMQRFLLFIKWFPLYSQPYYRNAILAFKCMHGHAPEYVSTISPNFLM